MNLSLRSSCFSLGHYWLIQKTMVKISAEGRRAFQLSKVMIFDALVSQISIDGTVSLWRIALTDAHSCGQLRWWRPATDSCRALLLAGCCKGMKRTVPKVYRMDDKCHTRAASSFSYCSLWPAWLCPSRSSEE